MFNIKGSLKEKERVLALPQWLENLDEQFWSPSSSIKSGIGEILTFPTTQRSNVSRNDAKDFKMWRWSWLKVIYSNLFSKVPKQTRSSEDSCYLSYSWPPNYLIVIQMVETINWFEIWLERNGNISYRWQKLQIIHHHLIWRSTRHF